MGQSGLAIKQVEQDIESKESSKSIKITTVPEKGSVALGYYYLGQNRPFDGITDNGEGYYRIYDSKTRIPVDYIIDKETTEKYKDLLPENVNSFKNKFDVQLVKDSGKETLLTVVDRKKVDIIDIFLNTFDLSGRAREYVSIYDPQDAFLAIKRDTANTLFILYFDLKVGRKFKVPLSTLMHTALDSGIYEINNPTEGLIPSYQKTKKDYMEEVEKNKMKED